MKPDTETIDKAPILNILEILAQTPVLENGEDGEDKKIKARCETAGFEVRFTYRI